MNNILPTDYQNFIAVSRYARWLDNEGRRETWNETVLRYVDYMNNKVKLNTSENKLEMRNLTMKFISNFYAFSSISFF